MRPLELVVEGFRSYHGREVFSWTDRRLVAIVGPIGSGKSSILDAIAFALYGKTPVFERDRKALINQRKELCRVELAFEVDADVWRVIRVIRRSGAAKHTLLRHPDADLSRKPLEIVSGDTPVNRRVEELLGLDFAAFTRSVLLAQNRFAEFLTSRAGERDAVLKKVFGFERLDTMRQRARERQAEAEGRVAELQKQVDVLETERLQLEALGVELGVAAKALAVLEQVAPQIKALAQVRDEARRAARQADEELERLTQIGGEAPPAARLADQLEASATARTRLETARQTLEQAVEALATAEAQRRATEEAVGTADALNRAEALLGQLDHGQAALDALADKHAPRIQEQTGARETLEAATCTVTDARQAASTAVATREAAREAVQQRRADHASTEKDVGDRAALQARRTGLRELAHTREVLDEQQQQATALQTRLTALDARLVAARDDLGSRQTALATAHQRVEAAAVEADACRAALEQARASLTARVAATGDDRALAGRRAEIQELERQRGAHAAARVVLETVQARVEELARQIEAARVALADAETTERAAEQARDGATGVLRDTELELHQAQHAEMAFTLRGDLTVGKPCPVCEQAVGRLPAAGVPVAVREAEAARQRASAALEAAESALKSAGATLAARQVELAASEGARTDGLGELGLAREAASRQEAQVREQERTLREVLGDGDLEAAVRRLEEALAAARAEVTRCDEGAREAAIKQTAAGHALDLAQREHDIAVAGVAELQGQVGQLEGDRAALRVRCEALQATVRALEASGDSEGAITRDEARLTAAEAAVQQAEATLREADSLAKDAAHDLELARRAASSANETLARLTREVAELELELQRQRAARDALTERVVALVGQGDLRAERGSLPGERSGARQNNLRGLLAGARRRLDEATAAVEAAGVLKTSGEAELEHARSGLERVRADESRLLAALSAVAGRLGYRSEERGSIDLSGLADRVCTLLEGARVRAGEARSAAVERLAAAERDRAGLLRQVGLDGTTDFDAVLSGARVRHGSLRGRVEEIQRRLERSGELSQAMQEAHAQVAIFRQLREDFAANRFAAFLIEEERAGLTRLGSERFELLTGGRYRFAPDGSFDVLDLSSAEARRDVKTLSGGETFLAALALALALAERVTRTGGRIDAFFLDEGFGSLDPPHLDLALDGIERLVQDSPRRLVVVVSHVEAMRERIDDLIVLGKDALTGDTVVGG